MNPRWLIRALCRFADGSMRRTLSSSWTPFYKLFPLFLWVYGLFWLAYDPRNVSLRKTILYFLVAGFASWWVGLYKRVSIEGDTLFVSNYIKEIRVPLADVERVKGPDLSTAHEIAIVLRAPSALGRKIRFAPKTFQAREIANDLRERAKVGD